MGGYTRNPGKNGSNCLYKKMLAEKPELELRRRMDKLEGLGKHWLSCENQNVPESLND